VSAALVEKTVASHEALAQHELEKVVACEAHVASRHALAGHELEKVVAREAQPASCHALAHMSWRRLWHVVVRIQERMWHLRRVVVMSW
jgi:hypothetical protein